MKPYKTPTGKYQVRWRVKRGGTVVRHKRTFQRYRDAQIFIENLASERNRDANAAKRTFNDYADRYLAAARSRVKARTLAHYSAGLVQAREFLGDRPVGGLRKSDADAYLAFLDKAMDGCRIRSLLSAWRTFSAVLDVAVDDEALPSNPARKVRLPTANGRSERKFQPAFLSESQVFDLAGQLSERAPYDLLVLFAAYTGLRRGEIAGLNMSDVRLWVSANTWKGKVYVSRTARLVAGAWTYDTPKTESSVREVPLAPWLAERLHEYIAAHLAAAEHDHPLWPGRARAGSGSGLPHGAVDWSSRWEPESFCRNLLAQAVREAGLGHVRFHDLRHTFASLCSHNGIPVERVSAWMGHSSIVITWTTYTHLFRGDDDHLAIEALGPPHSRRAPPRLASADRAGE